MVDMIDMAGAILSASEKRLEVVSANVANTGTAGYKSQVPFAEILAKVSGVDSFSPGQAPDISQATNFAPGKLSQTDNPLDLAISGQGFFKLRLDEMTYYSRHGQFGLDPDGRVVTAQGYALQTLDGQDLILPSSTVEILGDGTVLDGEIPIAKVGLFEPSDHRGLTAMGGSMFATDETNMVEAEKPDLRQGMIESANVELTVEMTEMMAALRQAEIGSRLVQTYDTLMGQAISTFGQGGR